VETVMNIENISPAWPQADSRPTPATPEPPVIRLEEIQSIIYLGMKGEFLAAERHLIDTFA